MPQRFNIDKKIISLVEESEEQLTRVFKVVDKISEHNQYKVIDAFQKCNIGAHHFAQSTGYGYSDIGREALGRVFAHTVKAQSAVVSPHIASGTHAITLALFALLRPLDTLISVTGRLYDTLNSVIGSEKGADTGSLADFAIKYKQVELTSDGDIDYENVIKTIEKCDKPKALFIQRSRGYEWRKALSNQQIKEFTQKLKSVYPDIIVIVDNCYGEFCETSEPLEAGADLIAGSLIKNPGGGIAPTGGYVAGRADLVELVENRLTSPGLGAQVGSYEASYRPFFQGLYYAPHVVGQALKGSILCAKVFETLGYEVFPTSLASRSDITQSIRLNSEKLLLAYTKGIQKAAAIDSRAVPIPDDMPGYDDKIVMAAGTFVQGASIELSADAPIKPPYIVYAQGALTYPHMKLGLMMALSEMGII
ncbi:MAG: hypothetical protein HN948_08345 [Clostridia bacterium]|nr:hypothetical protein [Clostridia bacterium]MBT7123003.1 hypothetical protein [Clostridia bacterium]